MRWALPLVCILLAGCLFKGGYSLRQVVRPAKFPWLEPPGPPTNAQPAATKGQRQEAVVLPPRELVFRLHWPGEVDGLWWFHVLESTNLRQWTLIASNLPGTNDLVVTNGLAGPRHYYRPYGTRERL